VASKGVGLVPRVRRRSQIAFAVSLIQILTASGLSDMVG